MQFDIHLNQFSQGSFHICMDRTFFIYFVNVQLTLKAVVCNYYFVIFAETVIMIQQ